MVPVAIHVHGEFQEGFFDPVVVARFGSLRKCKGLVAQASSACLADMV